jgi:asparagine synthase (glutamine-hydrolysing)
MPEPGKSKSLSLKVLMSAVYGVWEFQSGHLGTSNPLQQLKSQLSHRGTKLTEFSGKDLHMAELNDQIRIPAPSHRHSSTVQLVWDGRLDNGDELNKRFNLMVGDSNDDVAIVAALFETLLEDSFQHLKGDFAFALKSVNQPWLYLCRDPIGVRPLVYSMNTNYLIFASEIKPVLSLLPQTPELDHEGLSPYLLHSTLKTPDLERTPFKGIKNVKPGCFVRILPGSTHAQQYWDFQYTGRWRSATFEEAMNEFRQLFAQSVKRRMRAISPTAVSVSGGLDSSSIFAQAMQSTKESSPAPVGISYVSAAPDVDESQFLDDLDEMYSQKIVRINLSENAGIVDSLSEQVGTVEAPFVEYLWKATQAVLVEAKRNNARVLLTGHYGDQFLFSWAYLADLLNKGKITQSIRHLKQYSHWYNEDLSLTALRQIPRLLLRSWLPAPLLNALKKGRRLFAKSSRAELLRFATDSARLSAKHQRELPTSQSRHLYVQARSRYHMQCLEWYNKVSARQGMEVAFPMFDVDLIQFLIELPGDLQNRNGVPRAILREALRPILPSSITDRTWKADFSEVVNQTVTQELASAVSMLNQDSHLTKMGFVDPLEMAEYLRRASERLSNENTEAAWDIVDLLGLEHWLRIFCPINANLNNKGDRHERQENSQSQGEANL